MWNLLCTMNQHTKQILWNECSSGLCWICNYTAIAYHKVTISIRSIRSLYVGSRLNILNGSYRNGRSATAKARKCTCLCLLRSNKSTSISAVFQQRTRFFLQELDEVGFSLSSLHLKLEQRSMSSSVNRDELLAHPLQTELMAVLVFCRIDFP